MLTFLFYMQFERVRVVYKYAIEHIPKENAEVRFRLDFHCIIITRYIQAILNRL